MPSPDPIAASPSLTVSPRDGKPVVIAARAQLSLMEIIRTAGIYEMQAVCGGCCSCGTCHIYVDPADADRLPNLSDDEDAVLDTSDHRRPGSRLACQIPFHASLSGLCVQIAPED